MKERDALPPPEDAGAPTAPDEEAERVVKVSRGGAALLAQHVDRLGSGGDGLPPKPDTPECTISVSADAMAQLDEAARECDDGDPPEVEPPERCMHASAKVREILGGNATP